ncbi:hypothetical protein [uncultured Sphingomonas sp.]|uniref:hypothetical protein n=1 Tax=uncultured Sphingomonas sp. TaxID=158754 RepID=UPI0025F79265|nr:hypothetical protein [uncultured Sphingomonas sp.]
MTASSPWRRRLRVLAEFAILYGTLAVLDHALTGNTAFAGVSPNPYGVPVLVLALAYGTEAGFTAAILSTAIWLAFGQQVASSGDYLDRLLRLSLTPLLWFLVATAVGEVTNARVRRIQRLRRGRRAAANDAARLDTAYQELVDVNRTLQIRTAIDSASPGRVIALAAAAITAPIDQRRGALRDLLAVATKTDDFTCYRIAADQNARVWLRGAAAAARADILPQPLVQHLAHATDPLTVATIDDRPLLANIGVAAVALRRADGGLMGCLVVHHTSFEAIGSQSAAELGEIATWLPSVLELGAQTGPSVAGRAGRG